MQKPLPKKKKTIVKNVPVGRVYIQSSFNNTIVSITDDNGNLVAWASCGSVGFRGTKKATPYAATQTAKAVVEKAKEMGMQRARVFVSGVGTGREAAVRALVTGGLEVISIKDVTSIPHGGCRPPKPRKV